MHDDDGIALFIKLAEVENYTKAAKILKITTSTLSRQIRHLEDLLGVTLIKRDSHHFELSPQGEYVYQQFVTPIKQQQANLSNFIQHKDIIRGTLKVALPAALAFELITPKLNQFNKLYPQVKLMIKYTAQPIDLVKDDLNLAISTSLPLSQNNKIRLLKKFNLKLYTNKEYIKQYGLPQNLFDLQSHRGIGMMGLDGTIYDKYIFTNIKTGKEELFEFEFGIFINNMLHGIQLAKSGEYIVGLVEGVVNEEIKSGVLIPVLEDYILGELPCYLIRQDQNPSKLEQLFAEFIVECISKKGNN